MFGTRQTLWKGGGPRKLPFDTQKHKDPSWCPAASPRRFPPSELGTRSRNQLTLLNTLPSEHHPHHFFPDLHSNSCPVWANHPLAHQPGASTRPPPSPPLLQCCSESHPSTALLAHGPTDPGPFCQAEGTPRGGGYAGVGEDLGRSQIRVLFF